MSVSTRAARTLPRDVRSALRRLKRRGFGIDAAALAEPFEVGRDGRLRPRVSGALAVDAFGNLVVRLGEGLEQTPGSPVAIRTRVTGVLQHDATGRIELASDAIERLLPEPAQEGDIFVYRSGRLRPYRDGATGQALRKQSDGSWAAQALPTVVTDHGGLTGLADDDHPQYALDTDLAGYAPVGTLTTKGDMYVWTGAALVRLPVGSDGAPLVSSSSASRGVEYVSNGLQHQVAFQTLANAAATWASMPAAATFLFGSHRHVQQVDLTPYTHARLLLNKAGTAGFAGSVLKAKYATTYSTTVGSYSDLASSGSISVAIDSADTFQASSWTALASGAKADVFLCIEGSGGNGAVSPQFGSILLQFRRSA